MMGALDRIPWWMMSISDHLSRICEDIYQLILPLPFALNHVNVYLLRGDEGWTVLDCGLHTAEAAAIWSEAKQALGIQAKDLSQIILTHAHPDHYGMAGMMQKEAEAEGRELPVYLSVEEAAFAELMWKRAPHAKLMYRHLLQCGMPEETVREVSDTEHFTRKRTFPQANFAGFLMPGSQKRIGNRNCEVIAAPGHSEGQVIFYDEEDQLLFCGDHVLIKITPNIGFWPKSRPDPLGRYLASLKTLSAVKVSRALPGHRAIIQDWRGRLAELSAHHDARLAKTLLACEPPATAYEVAAQLFDPTRFTPHEWRFAMVEALAHLECLRVRGRLHRRGETVWQYERVN
ncbi:MAG: MBL fold metallo-hydrolase [Chloroflexi bacterium]|nr:MBL fold metallo-hydrolase [Chloroflexota bacterium]